MRSRLWWVLGVLAVTAIVVMAAGWYVVDRTFNPDCFDRAVVDRLAADPVEDVRPRGTELVWPATGPQCSWIEPRYEDASRSWTFAVADPGRVPAVAAELSAAAGRPGWRPTSSSTPQGDEVLLEMTKEMGSSEARFVVTTWTVDEFGATAERPVGTVMVSATTEITESP